jgi:hypothetical protein
VRSAGYATLHSSPVSLIERQTFRFSADSSHESCAGRLHQPAHPICLDNERYQGASGDALLYAKALVKDSPIAIPGLSADLVSQDDARLFAFINTLRLSVRAKVAAQQERGVSLSEIVVQVRELVRVSEEDARKQHAFPTGAFRAISRQAVAWCVEAYRPVAFKSGADLSAPNASDSPLRPVPTPVALAGRVPATLTILAED